jgi:hypothetical protein
MSEEWTGAGLPPVAAARIAEVRSSGTWSSALSTGEFAALRAVGFEPVGQVMGSAVYHVGRSGRYWGYHDCLYAGAGYVFGSVTPRCPWYLPPRSLYDVLHTSSDSKNSICATPSLA